LKISTKRRLTAIIIAFITIAIIVGIAFATNAFNGTEKQTPPDTTSEPAPTETSTDAPTELTVEEKQTVAANTTQTFFDALMSNVKEQIGEEKTNATLVTPNTSDQDSTGKAATVAIYAVTNIDGSFDYNANSEFLKQIVEKLKTDTSAPWTYVQSDDAAFEESEVLTAFKIYEDTDTPDNPAIVEVSYVKYTDEAGVDTYEMYISSTVY
jgi:uncharacterized membrane protein YdfJ with MMPL/SSD domain